MRLTTWSATTLCNPFNPIMHCTQWGHHTWWPCHNSPWGLLHCPLLINIIPLNQTPIIDKWTHCTYSDRLIQEPKWQENILEMCFCDQGVLPDQIKLKLQSNLYYKITDITAQTDVKMIYEEQQLTHTYHQTQCNGPPAPTAPVPPHTCLSWGKNLAGS